MITSLPVQIAEVALGQREHALTGYLSSIIGTETTLRDFVRLCFAELGIEVAFSGKDAHEKGVVIDMDEERLAELGLSPDIIRFGQTIVRADTNTGYSLDFNNEQHLDILVGELMVLALTTAKDKRSPSSMN